MNKRPVGRPPKQGGKLSPRERAVCDRFGVILTDKNITQEEAAAKMGVKQNAISRIITGANAPSLGMIFRIIDAFHVNPSWLLMGTGKMYADKTKENSISINPAQVQKLLKKIKETTEKLENITSK